MSKIIVVLVVLATVFGVMGAYSFASTKELCGSCCETNGSACEGTVLRDSDGDPLDCGSGVCYRCTAGASSGFCKVATTYDEGESCMYNTGNKTSCGFRTKYDCANDICSTDNKQESTVTCDPLTCTEEEC